MNNASVLTSLKSLGITLISASLFGMGCASAPPSVALPAGALPNVEIASFEHDIHAAQQKQADVLAPKNWEKASDKLNDAKKDFAKEGSNHDEALKDVAEGRAYLNRANEITTQASAALPSVIAARWAAVTARAGEFDTDNMISADNTLKSIGRDFEKGKASVDKEDSRALQAQYLDAELKAIKVSNLGPVRAKIDEARKNKAEKLSPRTLATAEQKLHKAETAITTDRHNTAMIKDLTGQAQAEADRLLTIVTTAQQSKSRTPEEIALDLEARNQALSNRDATIAGKNAAIAGQDAAMAKSRASNAEQLSEMQKSNTAMAAQQAFNQSFDEAQKKFSSSEAEVYKQNGNLLIRLKGLRFASGGSDLPAENAALLDKVKGVVETMNAQKVLVEGHTDSVGGQTSNEKLSQKRADAVAQYLVSSNAVTQDKVEATGFGYSRPLASNKSKQGRAENRRVDVVVTPSTPAQEQAQELPAGEGQPGATTPNAN